MMEMILTSSVLILLLALLRQVMRGKIHPCIQYALWLLAAARLLIPGTLFPMPVSVMGAVEELREPTQWAVTAAMPSAAVQSPPADGPSANFVTLPRNPEDGPSNFFVTRPPEILQAEDTLKLIWKAGVAVTGGVLIVSNLIFYLRLRKNRKQLILPNAPWSGGLPVYEAEDLPSPCLFGLFRPAVYLNEAAMDTEHPEHILAHEYAHYRHGDHVWALLRSVCLALHWYNPLVWWAASMSRRDCELACDASAIRRLGEDARIDYGQTLLGMVSSSRSPAALFHTATTMTAGKRAMKERIALIARRPRMRIITLIVVALLACLLAACSFGRAPEVLMEPADTVEPADTPEMPTAVTVSQTFSSNSGDTSYITDPDEVARLWELYQSFEYEGTYDPTGMRGWFIMVYFQFGDRTESEGDVYFLLAEHGISTQDGQDLRLKNIDEIYAEFLRLSADPAYSLPLSDPSEVMMRNARSIVEQIQNGADVSEWLPLMNCMDWGILRQAAVKAGMDEGDGSGAAVNIIADITRYVEENAATMTMGEYRYILSATEGLDGAPASGYAYMLYQMYVHSDIFAYVVLEQLTEEQRNVILDLFRSEWMYQRDLYGDTLPGREEVIAQLESDLEASIRVAPSEMTLSSEGAAFQFQILNALGNYALEYTSSDESVATVDRTGTVAAAGPGNAVITMHYEGAGGPLDFACSVLCDW